MPETCFDISDTVISMLECGAVGLVVLTFNQYLPPIRTLARDRFKWFIWGARLAFIALEVCWVGSPLARPSMDPVLGLNILDFPH